MANDVYRINEFDDDDRGGGHHNGHHNGDDISNGQLDGTISNNHLHHHHHHHKNKTENHHHQTMKPMMMNGNTKTVAINHSSYNNNNNHHQQQPQIHHYDDHQHHHLFDNIHHKIINISQQSLNTGTNVVDQAHINSIANHNKKFRQHHHHHHQQQHMNTKTEEANISSSSSSSSMMINSSLLTLRANLSTFLSSFLFLCVGVIFNLAVLAIIHERVPYDTATLPDIAFDLLPKYDLALNVSEYIIMFMSASVLLMIASHRYRWIIISRLFIILGLLYIFRAICMSVTQVPVSNKDYYCAPRLNLQETSAWELFKTVMWRIIYLSVGMGLSVNGHHTYCGDFIFSGHTVILVTSDLFLVYYWLSDRRPIYFQFIKYGYHLLVGTGIIAILVARGHYMVDVVLAIVISQLIFYIYHMLCHYAIIHSHYHQQQQQQQCSFLKQSSQCDNHYNHNEHNNHHQSTDTSIVIKSDSDSNKNNNNNNHPLTSGESFIYHHHHQQCQLERNPLNTWWYTIFEYFEKNTIHHQIEIVNSFEWPWKIFMKSKRQPLMLMIV
ncbi:sphingomyelin synthase [Dermatophagoides farinae]|uniref:Sphingomyelin synthase n=1 Tax=Dermatophagoides farinae TaxID=6954 RepID=A0A922I5R2_DERFA|nr:sphingomyelin synthase [Dermatophagoides farinae]